MPKNTDIKKNQKGLKSIYLSGSKSISNRALLLCEVNKILGLKVPKLKNLSTSSDTLTMKKGLKMLKQIKINEKLGQKNSKPINKKIRKTPRKIIDLGDAGTAVRFLTAFAAVTDKEMTITGSSRMQKRPIQDLADALNRLGCKVETTNSCPPVTISKSEFKESKFRGEKTRVKGNISSQFLSALLMVAPLMATFFKTRAKIKMEVSGKLTSIPYVRMTEKLIKIFQKEPKEFFIEGDASSASFLHLYSQLTGKKIRIKNLPKNSIQGDMIYPKLKPVGTIDMSETPDLVMPFSIFSAFTKGKTRITNISNLRIKESNRIKALEKELKKLGIKVKTRKDFIEIEGEEKEKIIRRNLKKHIKIETYGDHRIAMAFGVLKKTILPKLKIHPPSVVRKSYPEFLSDMNKLNRYK